MASNVVNGLLGSENFTGQPKIFVRCIEGDAREPSQDHYEIVSENEVKFDGDELP